MRYLVTGGAGFIGSHLVEELLAGGGEVFAVDDLSTGSAANLEPLKAHPRFHYQIDSVMNGPLVAELVDDADVVFHLAAAVGVFLVVESPVRTIETNVRGTETVLHHAAKKKRKVILASTSEVYGSSVSARFREEDDLVLGPPTQGRWSYACSKALDEFLALAYHRERGLPVVIARIFNTVGPRQTGRYGMVIPRFVAQALAGGPITIYGDGTQSRAFCFVKDTVRALVGLAADDRAVGGVFNVGSDQELTVNDLAERVRRIVNPSAAIARVPYDQAYAPGFRDMLRRVPDITKLRQLLAFEPSMSIDGIIESVRGHIAAHGDR
ncbi:MAG: NAD-dependent epimerase/dehydratase family protein [Planctomycetes bacterium]|nr:NAD-dependent epimerase/dehydratase family protein [Planctomycetota bacterium]